MNPNDTPLRVGLDQRLAAFRTGGISRYALELGHALRQFPDVAIQCLRHQSDSGASLDDVLLRTPAHFRFEPLALGLECRFRRLAFDVFHATDFVAPRVAGCPVVVTVHDLAFLRWPDLLSGDALAYYRNVTRQARRTTHWITPSAWTRAELSALAGVPDDRITVIPHGVSSFISQDAVIPRQRRSPYLVALGTVEPRKRYDLLLDALERMKPRPLLHIAGAAGWNTTALQERLRGTEGVVWHASASDIEINALLSNALALLIPSLAEGFGLGALEAMARGTPVISSGLGALSEVTGEAALVPERDEPRSWAAATERVIHDEAVWQALSAAGHARAAAFTWSEAARRTADVYRRVSG